MKIFAAVLLLSSVAIRSVVVVGGEDVEFAFDFDFDPPLRLGDDEYLQEDLITSQFSPNPYSGQNITKLILQGTLLLSNVDMNSNPPLAAFCHYDFHIQHASIPTTVPTFLDLVSSSEHCIEHLVFLPLSTIANAARHLDEANLSGLRPLQIGGFIFHQPKSGSSLLTNAITAAGHRVLSEPNALANILRCPHCSESTIANALVDVVYLLSRAPTNDNDNDNKVYIKLISTLNVETVRQAYPFTNYVFVYRDPNIVLQKLLNNRAYRRSCGYKQRSDPSAPLKEYFHEHHIEDLSGLDDTTLCAAGVAVNMLTLVDDPDLIYSLITYESLLTNDGLMSAMESLGVHPATPNGAEQPVLTDENDGNHNHRRRLDQIRKKRANRGRDEAFDAQKDAVFVTDAVKKANEKFLFFDLSRRHFEATVV